ncbi:MAG TPA: hypothetical protein VFT43_13165 [Candidatus Polarisedimenticolia bacterium]|nr:hypothetical protein [Candidatus Polarisedimenticolia bacterium]
MDTALCGIAAILVAGATACARPVNGATVLRGSALRVLPKESVALLVMDVRSLRDLESVSRWMKEMAAAAEQQGTFRQVKDRIGLETVKRLDRLGLAIVPQADGRLAYGLLAEGSFGQAKLREALGGQETLTFVEAEGKPDLSATILAGGNLAIGPKSVLEVLRTNASRGAGGIDGNDLLMGVLAGVRPQAQIWGAIDCRSLARLARESALTQGAVEKALAGAPIASSLVSLSFQTTLGKPAAFDLQGRADAEDNARKMADAARGLVALGRMGASQDKGREWLEFLDGIAIEQKGADLSLRGTLSEGLLASFAAKAHDGSTARP